jgi:hypothetical protein
MHTPFHCGATLAIGIVMLVSLASCGDGKITSSNEQSDGSTLTVGADGNGTVSAEVDGKNGKKSGWFDFGSEEWPASAPSYATAYPGAEISNISGEKRDGFDATVVRFTTKDSVDLVLDFYEARSREASMGSLTRADYGNIRMGTAQTAKQLLVIQANPGSEGTSVSLIFGELAS